jgi:hypothetical protein
MLRKEIQAALEAAAAISIHHEFVVAGSLSVLGLLAAPPELMAVMRMIWFGWNRGTRMACWIGTRLLPAPTLGWLCLILRIFKTFVLAWKSIGVTPNL